MSINDEGAPLLGASEGVKVQSTSGRAMAAGTGHGAASPEVADPNSLMVVSSRGESIFTEGVGLSWKNINVFARTQPKGMCGRLRNCFCCCLNTAKNETRKQLLFNVSGVVSPGTLLAILGASGAGKSTLLNVLNRRNIRRLEVEGDIQVNGLKVGDKMTLLSGYVQQEDLFIGRLTVREHLWFSASLRMGKRATKAEKHHRVEEVIQELGLGKCADTQIGIPGRVVGISGGQRKRLAFASEALTNPMLLFCDEPTSGLDSFMAETVVKALHAMAARGKAIVCTIHQPSSQVYALFDKVLLMAEGRVAFMGSSAELPGFFEGLGKQCPPSFNPADFYVHALAVTPGQEEESHRRIKVICSEYEQSPLFTEIEKETDELFTLAEETEIRIKSLKIKSRYRASCFIQFRVLLWRSFVTITREAALFHAKMINNIAVALIFGLVYLNTPYDQKGIMNINGALFLFQGQQSFSSVFPVVNTFVAEFPVFMREHHNGMYPTGTYYIAKILAELPVYILVPIVFNGIGYWMIGMYKGVTHFFIATAALFFVCNCAVSYGYLVSCVSSNLNLVLVLAPTLLVPLLLFGGLFINSGSTPVYFLWLEAISWFNYANEILVVNQWKDVRNISCSAEYGTLCIRTGAQVIQSLSYDKDNVAFDFILLAVLIFGYRLTSYIILYLRVRRRD